MASYGEYELREICLDIPSQRKKAQELVKDAGLTCSDDIRNDVDSYQGIFDPEEGLLGGAGRKGNVVKLVAVKESARSENLLNPLITRVRDCAFEEGEGNLFVFTKPEYRKVFQSLSFHPIAETDKVTLLESDRRGIRKYLDYLKKERKEGEEESGIILMNCNPFTKGHLHLIEEAGKRVGFLYIIPVKEDKSEFSYEERKGMMEDGTRHLKNVKILEGSPYQISAATFPTYFLKSTDDGAEEQLKLDLEIFRNHIAPALGAKTRFVGTEPTDALTSLYNEEMRRRLEGHLEVIERLQDEEGEAISASRVRRLLEDGGFSEAMRLVPSTTIPWLLAHIAKKALMEEANLENKPGLVTPSSQGSHADMDIHTLHRSIEALHPYFVKMAKPGLSTEELRGLGLQAEEAMLKATAGVNTHKGALFSMGLLLNAAAETLKGGEALTGKNLSRKMAARAAEFPRPGNTHGCDVEKRYGKGGALEEARKGFPKLWDSWLPYYRGMQGNPDSQHLLLLHIISELDDTNMLHRGGEKGARMGKELAREVKQHFSSEALDKMCKAFKENRLSPGGAADMLALTLTASRLVEEKKE